MIKINKDDIIIYLFSKVLNTYYKTLNKVLLKTF